MSSLPNNPTPQFATAEYAGSSDVCKSCNQRISGAYYRINGALACERCTTQLQSQIPTDSHTAFVRAALFGIGAAIAGLILYAAFGIITGIEIGYVALAVGWLIGKAMRKGSNGVGGRRYQIVAAVLTYAAVSMAAIPIYFSQASSKKRQDRRMCRRHHPARNQMAWMQTLLQQLRRIQTQRPSRAANLK